MIFVNYQMFGSSYTFTRQSVMMACWCFQTVSRDGNRCEQEAEHCVLYTVGPAAERPVASHAEQR